MAFTVYETTYSRAVKLSFDRQECTVELFGGMTQNDATARLGFIAVLPNPFLNLLFEDMDITPIGGGIWRCRAFYKSYVIASNPAVGGASPPPPPPPAPAGTDPLGPEYSWDISTGTEHITKSLATVQSVGVSEGGDIETPKNFGGAIGWVESTGEVQGVDRVIPKGEFSITKLFDYITLDYFNTLVSLVGSVNNNTFYSFDAGELLFLGASGQPRDSGGKVAVTYKFAVAKNQASVEITDELTITNKKGWEYIWVTYRTVKEGLLMVTRPKAAYLERIYPEKDFSQLLIGV